MSLVKVLLNESFTSGLQIVEDYPTSFGSLTVEELLDEPESKDRVALS
jgi:hypothetical protein